MLRKRGDIQNEAEFVCIEQLVPKDHLLRKIERSFDFDFIYAKVENLYSTTTGRPPLDPVVLFKMIFIGYLFGIRSERQLMKDIEVNVAYRWFLGMGLTDKTPDHSTISQNRRRRFNGTSVFQDIFDEIVLQAIERGFIDGSVIYTDSTHLKASANKKKFVRREVTGSTRSYLDELEKEVSEDRQAHGKKPLPPVKPDDKKDSDKGGKSNSGKDDKKKTTRSSTTDPESGYMCREGKPEGFFYLDHRSVDGLHNLITDVHVTPGNVHDSIPYLARLERQQQRFGFEIQAVGLDAGYLTNPVCRGLVKQNIYGVMPYVRPGGKKGMLRKNDFVYDEHFDCYLCPQDQVLEYSTTGRDGNRQYKSDPAVCAACPLLSKCTTSAKACKVISRHIWEHYKEQIVDHRYEHRGKRIYKRRKETVERSFADAKQLHGHRYARMRGLAKVAEQCLLAAACQNMKKIALIEHRVRLSACFWLKTALNRFTKALKTTGNHSSPECRSSAPLLTAA